ncbi:MAG: LemA family protein [Candidatus Aquicultorales bacterium]
MKNKWLIPVAVIVAVVILIGGTLGGYYNSFVVKEQVVDTQWAQVETQYQRRVDLIPNLVGAVKGVLKQEQKVFGDLAKARQGYAGARTTDEKVAASNQIESALSRLLVIVENYPQLKSSETVKDLMAQLEGTENRISTERRRYNEEVQTFNISVRRFPGMIFAGIFGFDKKPLFQSQAGAENAPKVDLDQ